MRWVFNASLAKSDDLSAMPVRAISAPAPDASLLTSLVRLILRLTSSHICALRSVLNFR